MVLLRNPPFFLMWLGQVASQSALRMFQISIMWWIIALSADGSGMDAGLFMVCGALPPIAFVHVIGRIIDTAKSRVILGSCAFLAFVFLGIVTAIFRFTTPVFWWICLAGFMIAILQAFMDPTLNKSVMQVVEKEDVESAVAFQSSTQSLANFGGAVLGAILIDRMGIANVILLGAAMFFTAGIFYLLVRFRDVARPEHPSGEKPISGWRILEKMPELKKILIGFGFVNFFVTPILLVIPLYTSKTLGASASVLGYLEASLWIGLLGGTFSSKFFGFIKSTIRLGALCMLTMGICFLVPGFIVNQSLYMSVLFVAGFALGVNNVKFISLFQKTVPALIKGRFFALMQAVIGMTFPLAYFIFGVLADHITPPRISIIQGVGVICVAAFFLNLVKIEHRISRHLDVMHQ